MYKIFKIYEGSGIYIVLTRSNQIFSEYLICEFDCSLREAKYKQQLIMNRYPNLLNKRKAYDHDKYNTRKKKWNQYADIYREKNKKKIKERARTKVICECGQKLQRKSLSKHIYTITHKNRMKQKNQM